MSVKIITLAFDAAQKGFDNEALQCFLAGKTVLQMKAEFFIQNGQAFWTILLEFEPISTSLEKKHADRSLNAEQQQLYDMLQQWRRDKAREEAIPVYVIATNKELTDIARKQSRSQDALQNITGFGKKKGQKHGNAIITIVKRFDKHRTEPEKDQLTDPPSDKTDPNHTS
jgi:superfamily II DNA helicase RecQ